MTNILLNGCCGKMGHAVYKAVCERDDCKIICGVDIYGESSDFPVFRSFFDVDLVPDVIIDFSNPDVLDDMLSYAQNNSIPCVICTTGFSEQQKEKVREASAKTAIFYSGNMSLGINLITELCKKAASVFGEGFDVEIIEKHHNQKIDAPSGTALMIADAVSQVLPDKQYIYDRHSVRKKRSKNEIGIHSVRGGTIVGEHEVIFAGHDEVLTISHQAQSKDVFAVGAVNASVFMHGKTSGIYDMFDLLASK